MMAEKHLSREMLGRALAGEGPMVERLLEHLFEVCPKCRRSFVAFVEEERRTGRSYGEISALVLARLAGQNLDMEALRKQATVDLTLLTRLPAKDRITRIRRALKRFKSPLLVDLLIRESRRQVSRGNPFSGRLLAESAHEVALRVDQGTFGSRWAMTSVARANAYRGNALRAAGDLKAAEPALLFACTFFEREGNGDPLVVAELNLLLASLRKDQRRFPEAQALLDGVIETYRACGDSAAMGRTLVKQGKLYFEMGEARKAIAATRKALPHIADDCCSRLYLCAQHNLALYLVEVDRCTEAEVLVEANSELYQRFPDPWVQHRLGWLKGKIARGLGELDRAAARFSRVRQGFLDDGLDLDGALVGLDLAEVHLERGEHGCVRALAEEVVPVFRAQEVDREVMAALLLFRQAAERETVTVKMLRTLVRQVGTVSRRPPECPS